MRQAAAVCLATVCAYAGIAYAGRLRERVRLLRETVLFLTQIKTEIAFSMDSAAAIFTSLSPAFGTSIPFVADCGERLRQGESFYTAWKTALAQACVRSPFKKEDVSLLLSFGNAFGTTDTQGQIANCELHLQLLQRNLADAQTALQTYAKPAAAIGILTGAGVYILMM